MRILFLVWTPSLPERLLNDPSVFYRCYHPVAALRDLGIYATLRHFTDIELEDIATYDRVIFFRPQFSDRFLELHGRVTELGLPCAASYDDLYFDIEMLRQSNFRGLGAPQQQILANRPYNYAQAMHFFDTFITSTQPLGDRIAQTRDDSRVHVQYNGASSEMISLARLYARTEERVPRRIGYFAGGASHSPDLAQIAPQLARALVDADAELFCVETVRIPALIQETGRVVTTPRLTYAEMIRAYASCALTLAPLHMNRFTASKSGIKYLEASLVGAASVATPIPDILRLADDRLVAVEDRAGWYDGIRTALDMPHSEEITRHQQERVVSNFSAAIEAQRLADFLQTL